MPSSLFTLFFLLFAVEALVIYRPEKRRLVCKEVDEEEGPIHRLKRDVYVDPKTREPVVLLGGRKPQSRVFIDDGDFDVVSDGLTPEELAQVKESIKKTCNNLDRDGHH